MGEKIFLMKRGSEEHPLPVSMKFSFTTSSERLVNALGIAP
jgi:hypothetical protein